MRTGAISKLSYFAVYDTYFLPRFSEGKIRMCIIHGYNVPMPPMYNVHKNSGCVLYMAKIRYLFHQHLSQQMFMEWNGVNGVEVKYPTLPTGSRGRQVRRRPHYQVTF